jgi:nucleoside-triphosphatase THEP1
LVLILLTGPVGAGKTTLCLRLANEARLRGRVVSGVLTPAVVEEDVKVGIDGLDVSTGERRPLARHAPAWGTFPGTRVGLYAFDDRVLDWMVALCARALADAETAQGLLVFVDEIGKLELNQGEGLASLIPALGQPHEARVIVIVRESLLDALMACVPDIEPRVVFLDPMCRQRAWADISALVFGDPAGL